MQQIRIIACCVSASNTLLSVILHILYDVSCTPFHVVMSYSTTYSILIYAHPNMYIFYSNM